MRLTQGRVGPTKGWPSRLGLVAWFAADRITGLNNNDAVTTWSDLSGNGRDVTQSVALNKPVYKTNIINGLPTVQFATTTTLVSSSFTAIAQPLTSIIVARYTTSGLFMVFLDGIASGNRHMIYYDGTSNPAKYVVNAGTDLKGAVGDTSFHVLSGVYSGTSSAIRVDGTETDGAANTNSLTGIRLGANYNATSGFLSGDIAEVAIFPANIGTAAARRIERYMGDKYALAVTG